MSFISLAFSYFERPYLLILLVPLVLFLIYFVRKNFVKVSSTKEFERKRKKLRVFVLVSRILIVLFLLIALASPYLESTKTVKGDPRVKILVDNSTSMELFDLGFANNLGSELEKRVPVEIYSVGFGEESRLGDAILGNIRKEDNVLLISDGNNNKGIELGDVAMQANSLSATVSGIILFPNKLDASVSILGADKTISNLENEFTVVVKKIEDREVNVVIEVDGSVIYNKKTKDEQITFKRVFKSGYHKITAKVLGSDYFDQNNIFYKAVKVVPKPKVLLVSDYPELEQLFGPLYDLEKAKKLPNSYDPYTAIVVDDVPAEELNDETDLLAGYLSEGNGMFVVGGRNSYDFGDYNGSRFEQILPVFVAKAGKQKGEINIAFVMDISQSTGVKFGEFTKVDVEKALAVGMLNNISLSHNVGFVVFNDLAYQLADMKPLLEHTGLTNKVTSLKFERGTNIANGLVAGIEMLQNIGGSKNIILISDGQNNLGYTPVLEVAKYASSLGIRIYTVGVGFDTDAGLMQQVADVTNAVYFQPEESQQIKLIFGDTEISADKRVFPVKIVDKNHFITHGLDLNAKVYGFNQIVPKNSAKMLLTTDVGDPLLAVWRFGLGRVASLGSDARVFGFELLNRRNSALLTRITNWVIGDPERKNERFIDVPDGRINEPIIITVKSDVQPSSDEIALYKIDENLYRGTTVINNTGFNELIGSVFAVNYKREYQDIGVSPELNNLVLNTGGQMFYADNIDQIVDFVKQRSKREILTRVSYSWIFLLAALLIFLSEVIIRRLVLYKVL